MSKDTPGTESAANATDADKIFEERGPKTIIRLLTVGAYMFSVSFAAIALSGYYIFLWHPPNSRLIHAHAAHLKSDSEMGFLVADSLTEILTNKSKIYEHNNTLTEAEANNRYKYVSNPTQSVMQNDRLSNFKNDMDNEVFFENDEELVAREENEKSEKLQSGISEVFIKLVYNFFNPLTTGIEKRGILL